MGSYVPKVSGLARWCVTRGGAGGTMSHMTQVVSPTAAPKQTRLHPSKKGYKACSVCRKWKPPEEFTEDEAFEGGRRRECIDCQRKVEAEQAVRTNAAEAIAKQVETELAPSSRELVIAYWKAGFTPTEVAVKVEGYTPEDVRTAVATWKAENIDQNTREIERQKALIVYDELTVQARERGDIKEARLCQGDKLKALGIVQQGGATMKFEFNQTNNVLESRLEKWAEREGLLEVEALPESSSDSVPSPEGAPTP